ncbi:hypothetical protein BDR06DRAFT_958388 [Suillus hirtellus]|nr:hypothetical protein BDR06DRAFT_958388 [Suillus hirtellus]
MTVLDISKLGSYVLLLSVAFAQILVVGAAENTDDVNGVTCEWIPAIVSSRTDELLAVNHF